MPKSETVDRVNIRVADEVFIATALLHRENPERDSFTIPEIVDRAAKENLHGFPRPGVGVHAWRHCVANAVPDPNRYKMLYATSRHTRRLLRSTDDVHPQRTGKTWPDPDQIPERYRELVDWVKEQFGESSMSGQWLGGVLELRGAGAKLWSSEDADDYVRRLREDWT